jgi:NADH-quinone oxidoreductase subunit A
MKIHYPPYLSDYFPILVFMAIAVFLSVVLILIPYLVARRRPDKDKNATYECGFDPFGEARHKFDIRFYLVAILFIIFDIEIAFLFPWAISLKKIGIFGFWSMMIFLAILTIAFVYEWKKGALEWE